MIENNQTFVSNFKIVPKDQPGNRKKWRKLLINSGKVNIFSKS
jgi:hypothetical protein